MPILPGTPEPGVAVKALTPWEKYQAALATYQGAPGNQLPMGGAAQGAAIGMAPPSATDQVLPNAAKIAGMVAVKKAVASQLANQAGSQLAQTAAQNAAWNAGADAATSAGAQAVGQTAATQGAASTAAETGLGSTLGLGLGTALGGGAVAAYYGPSYQKYLKALSKGPNADEAVKSAALSNPMTAWAVPLADFAGIKIKTGKHKDQLARDQVRSYMKEKGLIDDKYNLTNADQSLFDIGRDGGDPQYNVDFTRSGIGETVGRANSIATLLTGGDAKLTSDFAGYLTNAATSSGDPNANLRGYLDKMGMNQRGAYDAIEALKLGTQKQAELQNGINQIYGNTGFSAGGILNKAPTPRKDSPGFKNGKRINYAR